MSEGQLILQSWESVISDFLEKKISESPMFKAREFIEKKDRDIASEKDEIKKERIKTARDKKESDLKILRSNASNEFRNWFEKQIEDRKGWPFSTFRIKKTTHPLKFTHGACSGEGVLLQKTYSDDKLLTTASLKKTVIFDMAHNNGVAVTLSRFISLSHNGSMIFDLILKDDFAFLNPFIENEAQLEKWKSALKGLVFNSEVMTVDKAKQIYFPIKDVTEYHLLIPLFPSSLSEEIYHSQINVKYSEGSKNIRKASVESKYYADPFISYPNLGVQKFGGAQAQNISMLNKGRSWKADSKDKTAWGITYLMNTAPPIWQSQLKPPMYKKSFFDTQLRYHVSKDDIDYLRDFLIRFDKIELSIKHPKRKQWINDWVGRIIDSILDYATIIQDIESGWTANNDIKLKREHQLFLDPYRDDELFKAERKRNVWQAVVCTDFARWLNLVLVGKDKKFSPQPDHTRMWLEFMESALREFDELVAMETKATKVVE